MLVAEVRHFNVFESTVARVTEHFVAWLKFASVLIFAKFLQFIITALSKTIVSVYSVAWTSKKISK